VAKVLTQPEMVQRLAGFNVQAKASTPAQSAQLLDNDIKRWSEVIAKAGQAPQCGPLCLDAIASPSHRDTGFFLLELDNKKTHRVATVGF
jgi:hypothetical protein